MKKYGLFLAWLVALFGLLLTQFADIALQWPVCHLCWYQRICIYPLVILLGIAAFKNEKVIIPYALPFPAMGFLFAAYQYLEQMIPGFSPIDLCTQAIPCSEIHFKWLGFITLPFLSMIGCALIFIFIERSRD
jgi:disulfide bond formation protein DsbB